MLIEKKLTYKEIGNTYGVSGVYIRKICLKMGIQIPVRCKRAGSHNKGKIKESNKIICLNCNNIYHRINKKNNFCGFKCSSEYRIKQTLIKWLNNQDAYADKVMQLYKHPIRKYLFDDQKGCCKICGIINEWNGKKMVFILDHINGNAANNRKENLRLICHNCDSQLDTYKSKNTKSARTKRYKTK